MNITTYENTVKKGTIKAHGRSDGLREMSEQLSEMQKIVTAPMSVDTPEQDGDKAPETAAAEGIEGCSFDKICDPRRKAAFWRN